MSQHADDEDQALHDDDDAFDIDRVKQQAIGALGPARRHLLRLLDHDYLPSDGVLTEVLRSIEECVERLT